MNRSEFIEITSDMEKYYQEEYNNEQRKYIYDTFKNMEKDRYILLTQKAIQNCKYLPKIANLLELEQGLPKIEEPGKEKVECKICGGSGLVMYNKQIPNGDIKLKYQYVARCLCKNADDISKSIPTIQEIGLY